MADRVCSKCEKPDGGRRVCRKCHNADMKAQYVRNGPKLRAKSRAWYARHKDEIRARDVRKRLANRARYLVNKARYRAKSRGLAFGIDAEETLRLQQVIDRGLCEYTGWRFDLSGRRGALAPSIDRIDSTKGYVKGNLRIICFMVNVVFNKWGQGAVEAIVQAGKSHGEKRPIKIRKSRIPASGFGPPAPSSMSLESGLAAS